MEGGRGGGREVKKKSGSRSATPGKGKEDSREQRIEGGRNVKWEDAQRDLWRNKGREDGGRFNEGGGLPRKDDNGDRTL